MDALDDLGVLEDTLVYYIIGDNGASAEGTPNGCFNELVVLNGAAGLETTEFMVSRIDDFGTPDAYNHYAVGWAHAMDTPYQWTKQVASHWGGTRNGTIVHWPAGIKAKGEVRPQFHHVIDVAATVLEPPGCPSRRASTASSSSRSRACAWRTRSTTRAPRPAHDAVLRDVLQPGHLPRGLDGGHSAQHALGDGDEMPALRRRRLGALRARRLDAGARHRRGEAREARRAPAAVPDRGGEVQRAAPRRPPLRAVQPRPRRAAAAGHGTSQLLFGPWDACPRTRSSRSKNKSHAITAEIVVPEGGPRA